METSSSRLKPQETTVVELDELCTFLTKKRKIRVWEPVCRETRRILDWEVGCRGIKTLRKLWKRLQLFKIEVYCADHWKPYNAVLPAGRLVQSKAETYINFNESRKYDSQYGSFLLGMDEFLCFYSKCSLERIRVLLAVLSF